MYTEHFKLKEPPFSLTPDTDYYYNYKSHQEALDVLAVALGNDDGIIKIVGEVGTGKTLLCRKLLKSLADNCRVFYLPNPVLEPAALYQSLAEELGIYIFLNMTMLDMTQKISEALAALQASGKKFVICIDEAQAMPRQTLEALRLLTNLETEKRKLLQIVLFAQPEFDTLLAGNDYRQIRQRITFSYHLQTLDRSAVTAYVNYRLYVAGYTGGSLFADAALAAIYRASRGVPRLVNVLCHKAMLAAYAKGLPTVEEPQALLAIRDTEDATQPTPFCIRGGRDSVLIIGVFVVIWILLILARSQGLP